ncbi:TetR/AcrR family transcriptional regulator [Nocardioides sp. CFH 31398]|uniref:TetR/AcrR family transcriptional regulator n=1 Tax=Nocardioides sp. CFH 31398 TaxID=2919579 RepID=UPI001F051A73|nr:TetR/AcrR family transcriptional regulator [Nocardioides sp. CFH 31398]MCH1866060.1 TetR/AcrR family transcriptional regulator [Nocardioides sp. CFH 31398]
MSTREQVLDAALRTLNADPTASLATIAEAAGVGRATLHRHFPGRDDLVRELGDRSLDRWEQTQDASGMADAIADGGAEAVTACLHSMFPRLVVDAEDHGFALTDSFLVCDPELAARTAALEEREVGLWRTAQAAGVVRPELPARWYLHAGYGLLVAARDALRAGDVARRDVADLVLDTLLHGIGTSTPTTTSTTTTPEGGAR